VISCLRRAGVEVLERHVDVWDRQEHKFRAGPTAAIRVALAEWRLRGGPRDGFEAVIVGYPGHFDMPQARKVAGKRPLVFNPLVSLADTLVADRGRFRHGSLAARVLKATDRRALRLADLVVADTDANAGFLADVGEIPRERVEVAYVGAEDRLFRPGWQPAAAFHALFVGKLIPLHGVDTILEAARLTPEIPFRIVGSGQLDSLLAEAPENVEHIPWIEYERLPDEIQTAGCALGIFGLSEKASRVIPNKAFQALACSVPLITGDTRGARELLVNDDTALLVPPGDADALAGAIGRLAADEALRKRIGERGRALYEERLSEDVLGARWRGLIEALL
jgi:glycosyltransferase involved in cell wall biosynthesis